MIILLLKRTLVARSKTCGLDMKQLNCKTSMSRLYHDNVVPTNATIDATTTTTTTTTTMSRLPQLSSSPFFVPTIKTKSTPTINTQQKYHSRGSCFDIDMQRRPFSSNNGGIDENNNNKPLFLWIDPMAGVVVNNSNNTNNNNTTSSFRQRSLPLLVPEPRPKVPNVTTPEEALHLVQQQYALADNNNNNDDHRQQQQFVGGMGENDAGVAFAAISNATVDILQYQCQWLQDTMELIRQERHGIPFTIYTTGLVTLQHHHDADDGGTNNNMSYSSSSLAELGVDVLQVSLLAGTPADYINATTTNQHHQQQHPPFQQSDFGQVCGFVAHALEEQVAAVEVGVLAPYATSGRSLAMALGAQHVHVYQQVEW